MRITKGMDWRWSGRGHRYVDRNIREAFSNISLKEVHHMRMQISRMGSGFFGKSAEDLRRLGWRFIAIADIIEHSTKDKH